MFVNYIISRLIIVKKKTQTKKAKPVDVFMITYLKEKALVQTFSLVS